MPRKTANPSVRPDARAEKRSRRRSPAGVIAKEGAEGAVRDRTTRHNDDVPGEDRVLAAGDPDVSGIEAGHAGESVPGGSTPTPNQSGVDEIGRALGVEELDQRELRSVIATLRARDRRRAEEEPTEDG